MFIRIKHIKKKNGKAYPYAYVVANRWMKRGKVSKQKVKKYLGRVYFLEKKSPHDFFEFYSIKDVKGYIGNIDKKGIINDLIMFELVNHGFKDSRGFLINGNIYFDKNNNELFVNNEKRINSGEINKKNINNSKTNNKKITNNSYINDTTTNSDKINKEIINDKEIHNKKTRSGIINNQKLTITNNNIKNKKIALAMNGGFLCNYTIKRLFSRFEGDEREVGFKLANAFVEAGINAPEELFVALFEKTIS